MPFNIERGHIQVLIGGRADGTVVDTCATTEGRLGGAYGSYRPIELVLAVEGILKVGLCVGTI
jgi:hypothetical protein